MHLMIDDQYESMPWELVDAVVFDVGNVLLEYALEEELELFFPGDKEKQALVEHKVFRSPYWAMLDHGSLTVDEAITAMSGRDKDLEPDLRRFLTCFPEFNREKTEGVAAASACKAHGKKIYILSNYQGWAIDWLKKQFPFFSMFDGMIISSEVKCVKPNPDIYQLLIDTYHLIPERTLFIDDSSANISGAMHMGWQGFCFDRHGKLRSFIGD